MPRRTDHEQRRREIASAVWRIAADLGLEAVSMREVAAEAGVSLRLVQYYFETKHNLLVLALRYLHERGERRAQARIAAQLDQSVRGVVRTLLTELLPLDAERELSLRVHRAYFSRTHSDPQLAQAFVHDETPIEDLVTSLLRRAVLPPGTQPRLEANLLVAGLTGLGLDVLHGRFTPDEVLVTLDYHLDRLFQA
ncbi:TetR/AcrR family transcriptional regulator [Amycolatopsis sp. FDAARGOS 1241]|uniref:TetR/AcrR family transcriptional regulator n=1 Tax=Amycolatopsis sp. FDAARGOS 1241 TaxID=2778070 RepID=UPI0019520155|nr:TetR/AcrR family transcriptional regulator [Amycolatopsis sp. FDAARGOS 1241]QRP47003.1 TetR/AcrR family transcriptional regulator [Amycolatopsis sp. FDAARGOS 1241]